MSKKNNTAKSVTPKKAAKGATKSAAKGKGGARAKKTASQPTEVIGTLISPRGKSYDVTSAAGFARRFSSLDSSALKKVLDGTRQSHKGWTRGGAAAQA